jgi:phage terminase large subunit-like protein
VAYTPDKDKVARAYSVQSIFESGAVWAPKGKSYADMVIDQCAAFPTGSHDDLVDCVVQALIRFRQSGRLSLDTDPFEEAAPKAPKKKNFSYYA